MPSSFRRLLQRLVAMLALARRGRMRHLRTVWVTAVATLVAGAIVVVGGMPNEWASATTPTIAQAPYLVGRGIADSTGQVAGSDKQGYEAPTVKTVGLRGRLHARAFVIVDRRSSKRIVYAIADVGLLDNTLRDAVIAKVQAVTGSTLYTGSNVLLSINHTHSSPGGFLHYNIDNMGTPGFQKANFDAVVDGLSTAIIRAHRDLAPGTLSTATGGLTDASMNRSLDGFSRNPESDRAYFPEGIDPQTTDLVMQREGKDVGAINWFATHGTSMRKEGVLVNGDNKGYASWYWEHVVHGVDYLDTSTAPSFVAGFAQTNAGDMTPDLGLQPGTGPTADDLTNTQIIGGRQQAAAAKLAAGPMAPITGPIDYRFTYIDIAHTIVSPTYTGVGRTHSTCSGAYGVAFAAGSKEDGPGLDFLNEGTNKNPPFDQVWNALYTASPALKDCQSPKDIIIPSGDLGWTPQIVPIQLLRIGQLYLVALPNEATVVSGLRMRRTVAAIVDQPLENVILAGYANDYAGYVTTPEEYSAQNYEAGHTLYGQWTLGAFQQEMAELATDMVTGEDTPITVEPPSYAPGLWPSLPDMHVVDLPVLGHRFGDVLAQPAASYGRGQTAQAAFVGAYPNRNLRHGSTYLSVERYVNGTWVRVADDNDWYTTFAWSDQGLGASKVTIAWTIPSTTSAGTYRIRYLGDALSLTGDQGISGVSRAFSVN